MPHILILMSDTGGGHRAAAEALVQAIDQLDGERIFTTEVVDFIRATAMPPWHRVGRLYRPTINHACWLWALSFKLTSPLWVKSTLNGLVASIAGPKLVQLLRQHPADMVVSTHGLATSVPGRLLRRLRPDVPFITIVTDLATAHPFWFWKGATRTYVASNVARQRAIAAGVPAHTVWQCGLPIDLRFTTLPRQRRALKAEYGLPKQRPMVLVAGGGEGMGDLGALARTVAQSGLPLAQMVIAGRNERLRRRLCKMEWAIPTVVTGFVRDMPRRMAAADLLITKAGPSTLSEGVAATLPILITGYIPGQEAGNVRWITESGVGRFTPTLDEVGSALTGMFSEAGPTVLHRQAQRAAAALAQPSAALDIAEQLMALALRRSQPRPYQLQLK